MGSIIPAAATPVAQSRGALRKSRASGKWIPRRFSIDIDEPHELGGTNRFANPQSICWRRSTRA
jgi:hypothetical protein